MNKVEMGLRLLECDHDLNSISMPFYLIICAIASIIVLMFLHLKKSVFVRKRKYFFFYFLLPFLLIYSAVLIVAIYTDIQASNHLQSFDLNGDGFYSTDEQSIEQRIALGKVVRDTGRNMAVFTGALFSLVLSSIVYIFSKVVFQVKHR